MSGGVDSSAVCAILKQEGWEVIGITLRFFSPGGKPVCCGADESISRAREVCETLGIRHYVKDARTLFKEKVMENFASAYLSGLTPNPCVECNRFLKFDYLFKIAEGLGAGALATGHYAVLKKGEDGIELCRGADPLKDQSYFLYCIPRKILPSLLFPLGNLKKEETRRIAAGYKLPAARSKESKDICFIPDGDYVKWLKEKGGFKSESGYIKDENGKILGRHKGYFNFTVGQRRNLGISAGERLYVSSIKPAENEVIVSSLDGAMFSGLEVSALNWLSDFRPRKGLKCMVQIRYRHKPCEALIEAELTGAVRLRFSRKQFAVTCGQSAVFYEGGRVLGGGIISAALK